MASSLRLDWAGISLQLHADHSIEWPSGELLIADVHLGKAMHFRKHGLGVPQAIAEAELQRLNDLLEAHPTRKLIILGDLFHSAPNAEWDMFLQWLENHPELEVLVVLGNHDAHLKKPLHPRMQIAAQWALNGIQLQHQPEETEDVAIICGHIHPAYRLKGRGKQSLTLPCFFISRHTLILPAFGRFTGKHILQPMAGQKVAISSGKQLQLLEF